MYIVDGMVVLDLVVPSCCQYSSTTWECCLVSVGRGQGKLLLAVTEALEQTCSIRK